MAHSYILKLLKYAKIAIAIITAIIPVNMAKADTSTTTDYIFLVDNKRQSCQQIGSAYQQIESFETTNFYVNICQKENNYYYLGEAKTGTIRAIFLPADADTSQKAYRANNGNVSYLVAISDEGATLTIERNGTPVAIELSENKQCLNFHTVLPVQITSQIDFLNHNNGKTTTVRQIISDNNYVRLHHVKTTQIDRFYEFQLSNEYNTEAFLNSLQCQ